MPVRALCLTVFAAASAGLAAAADWPQWQGPNRDARSGDKGLYRDWPKEGPKLLWKVDDKDKVGIGYAAPAVVGDKVYVLGGGEKEDSCVCLNANDGAVVWKTPIGPRFSNPMWGSGPRSTPTVDGDRLYALGATGDLVCLNRADGKVVWSKNLVKDLGGSPPPANWGYSESPLVDGDKLVCTPGSKGGMAALNKKTGEVVWQCKELDDQASFSSAVVTVAGGVRQYVQQSMKNGYGVRATDGKVLWKVSGIKRAIAVIPTPVVYKDHVFFTTGYNAGCELHKLETDGEGGVKATEVYVNKAVINHHGGVVVVDDYLYGYSEGRGWVCYDLLKGENQPAWSSKDLGKGSISYADGSLFCYAETDGTLARINATTKGWEETGRFKIPKLSAVTPKRKGVWAHPVIANGKLYLRDYELLYCYDIGGPGA